MSAKFQLSSEEWLIREKGFHSSKQGMYESLFALGNGYLGVRGSLEENPHGSYRGIYIAGIFDKSEGYVPEIVKAPGWTDFSVWVDGQKFSVDNCKILFHERILDMRTGILHRTTRFRNHAGKIIKLETRRIVFAHQVRGAIIDISIIPENFSGELKVISGLNGDVTNRGYFAGERIKHLTPITMERDKDHIYLEVESRDDKTKIAMAANTFIKGSPMEIIKVSRIYGEKFAHEISFKAEEGKTYQFVKWISTFTSREGYERQLKAATTDFLHDMIHAGLDYYLQKHLEVREKEWEKADIIIKGDQQAQKSIRFNLYHLIAAKPHHDPTVSIGAKFLTGEGYKGHTFWDVEIFILPFYIFTFPEEARKLLMYRYYTLKGALKNGKDLGYKGAKYAWESADTGVETTPSYGLRADDTSDKIFTGEEEHHIVADVAYGIHKYVEATGDLKFLYKYGMEIIFRTARFWLSRVEKRRNRYEVRKVIGPDEFHEHVDNNAFTSYLAKWNLNFAVDLCKRMREETPEMYKVIARKCKIKDAEIEKMETVAKDLFIPYDPESGLMEQFEGYFSLDNYTISELDKNGLPLFPKGVNKANLPRTQLIKQADVVLLMYLFLDRFSPEVKKKNYQHYEARTLHRSSLSLCVYALMGLETGEHKRAYNYFLKTSQIDLVDANRNTQDGIHAAATGGAWMTVIHGFAGMKVRQGVLSFDPWLPKSWQELSYIFNWQGSAIKVEINHKTVVFHALSMKKKDICVEVQGKSVYLKTNKAAKVILKKRKT